MNIPLIDLRAQFNSLKTEILQTVERVLDSGVYVNGSEVSLFEQEIATFTQSQYAVSTANGTDSLILAFHACGIGQGDEVITSPYTFFATAEAIARVGAIPVFADINPNTYNLCPELMEARITEKTKAIVPVHIFGQPADMDAIVDIAERHNLYVIEDACQALGACYKEKPVGSIGHVSCISFFPTKNLGGYGDGGVVLTNDEGIANQIRLLAAHGSIQRYYHDVIGYNSRLDELQAAVLRIKLRKLPEWNDHRQRKAEVYSNLLRDIDIKLPYVSKDVTHVYHLYLIETEKREQLSSHLRQLGVASGHYYPCPLHLQRAFAYLGYKPGDLPVAEAVSHRALALPMYPELTYEQQMHIGDAMHQFFRSSLNGARDVSV